ncbi:MAG: FtsX-like permease family protein [bacterium]
MKKLRVKMRRDLWRMRWRALAIVLTLASGVATYVGTYTGVLSIFRTRDTVYRQLHFADLEVRFSPQDVNRLPDLARLKGVQKLERRLLFPGIIKRPGHPSLMAVITLLETPTPDIHALQFVEGRPFRSDEPDAVVIERTLAEYHGYGVGDTIAVKVGETTYDGRIVGIVISPEYFVSTSNPDYFIPEKGSLGVVFGNLERVSDSLGYRMVNDLLFRFAPGVDPAALSHDISSQLSTLGIEQVIPQKRHFSYEYIQTQIDAIQFFIPAIVIIVLGLASIITLINFHRMMATERRELGTLMALGYDPRVLLRAYLEGSMVLGAIGSLLGLALSFPIRDIFAYVCAESMGMRLIWLTTDFVTMAKGVTVGLLLAVGSAAIPVLQLLRLSPQQVIRESRRPVESRERSWSLLSQRIFRLPASYLYGLRNLLRRRGRTVATLGSIGLALGVATAYRMSTASINETLRRRYEGDPWQLSVDFLSPVFQDRFVELKRIPHVKQIEPYFRNYVALEKDGRFENSTLLGIRADSRMTRPPLASGRAPASDDHREIVLSSGLARKIGAEIGDWVNVHALNRSHPFRLVGLSSEVVASLSIVPFRAAQEICQSPDKASGIFLQADAPFTQLREELYRRDFVGSVVEKGELLDQIRGVTSVMFVVLDIAAGINIFVAVLFILTSIHLSVLETEGEFATLKAIGYGRGSTTRILLAETAAYAVGAALLSLPVAALLSVYLNHRMGQAWFRVDTFFFPAEFMKVLIPAFVLILSGAYPGLRHIFHLDISTAIRARVID